MAYNPYQCYGDKIGVADCIGNWGFSNSIATKGNELSRIKCLMERMDQLSPPKPTTMYVRYDRSRDPGAFCAKPSDRACMAPWVCWQNRPLIVHDSCAQIIKMESLNSVRKEIEGIPPPNRYYLQVGNHYVFKQGPGCCPQPSCVATPCPPM